MNWTSEMPPKAGIYWYRRRTEVGGLNGAEPVKVTSDGCAIFLGGRRRIKPEELGKCAWGDPIPAPT